jgi:hypothetical protein
MRLARVPFANRTALVESSQRLIMPLPNIDALRIATELPGLVRAEAAVARAWLEEHHKEFESVEFNVRLGVGALVPAGSPEFMQRFIRSSTTKRADMVLHLGRDITIVELKVRVGGSAFGQLMLYKKLYLQEHPDVQRVHLVAAGITIEPDVADFYAEHGITVELFPSAWTAAIPANQGE